ncbi:glycine oxidase ThiO [Vreelandella aquamarina]|uniref:Glycine oxidase n=1 Tax=Vreelandella aquamarina TaxID=77097 RepID=A0A1N6CXA2_9GAMM|nr:glycine oxidase ThiO [Halomonas meridiana]SIN63170.1 glycine oxidase [Halomonas meridiana]SIN70933.1 glycine oxidase [Halomonas meridiana]SIO44188.1 glycine oxidase [Halomonas meridiana]
MSDFLIIGGGVIGMMTALQLADAGQNITLVERGACGKEASWAGGGIVSPLYPWRYGEPVSQLSRWSEGVYPTLALRLLEETGIDPEYRQKGLLYLNVDDDDAALRWARQLGKPLERVDASFVHQKEPEAAAPEGSALWMPTLGSVRNPRLGQALRARLAAMPNVTLIEQCSVQGFIQRQGRMVGVDTNQGEQLAEQLVVCGGAWAAQLLEGLNVRLPVRPVKGQMIAYQAPPGLVQRVVLKDGRYVIPRSDGLLLVGSTLEEAGFDKATDEEALASLKRSAENIIPALADCPVAHHWAGLRPGSPEGIPFIGALPDFPNVFVNAGHYRNGLVLAPASTHLLADQLLGRKPLMDPTPYQPTAARLA